MAEAQIAENTIETEAPARGRRRILMFTVPVLLIIAGLIYWWSQQGQVSTDNAYVKLDKISLAPEVNGPLTEVFVKENDVVKKGQLLFRIDREPYEVKLAEANAQIAEAQADYTALAGAADLSGANISAAREDIAFAQTRFARQKALMDRGFTTKADYDAASHAVSQARDALKLAIAEQGEARAKMARGAAVPDQDPRVASALAQKANAELNLRRTEVRAPIAGRIAEADRLHPGQLMIQSLPVLTLVADDSVYVEANFKETQLKSMRVGQRAEVSFDAYPELKLKGHVQAIGAGTGSEFSVLPAQNATGNWVKVTQRVPVRIAIDGTSNRRLIAGLSSHVTVYTDDGSSTDKGR